MEEIWIQILTDKWFNAFLVIIFIVWFGYWLYKFGSILLDILRKFLASLLLEFRDMISSIKDLGKDEKESAILHSREHDIIINKLDKLIDKK